MRALYTAATGMMAQEKNVQTISNNIANMRTTAFKRQRVGFQDMLYQIDRRAGAATSDAGTIVPAGVEIGSGVRTVATPRIMTQGNVSPTDKEYDIAIRGEGFFRIQMPDGTTSYTRDGSFELDAEGQIVTVDGYVVDPGITIPPEASAISVSSDGMVQATLPGQAAPQDLGQFQMARFINKSGLEGIGDNLYRETGASGPEIAGIAGQEGFGTLLQGHLEEANVNAVTEISDLISAQRAYEMNARVVSAADSMLEATSNLR